jgi:outer membrane immunogenic protein
MRLSFVAAAGLLIMGVVTTASAADLGVAPRGRPARVVAPAPPIYTSWTGFYIGGNIGGGWSHTTVSGTTTGTISGVAFPEEFFSSSGSGSGIVGGGQLGYNYEFAPRWVTGIEADIDAAHITGSETHCSTTALGMTTSCAATSGKIDDFGTVRGRLGYAFFNNFLLYGTGGFAWAHDSNTATPTCNGAACPGATRPFTFNSATSSSTPDGWTAGGGIEWRFLPNWTARVEYLHLQFNNISTTDNFTGTVIGHPVVSTSQSSANSGVDVVRFGVNYLFNWGPAPVWR